MTKPDKEYLTATGAAELADLIRSYWAKKGHVVRVWVETHKADLKDCRALSVVRSNLFNGLPGGAA
jgi:hypothetical protein